MTWMQESSLCDWKRKNGCMNLEKSHSASVGVVFSSDPNGTDVYAFHQRASDAASDLPFSKPSYKKRYEL